MILQFFISKRIWTITSFGLSRRHALALLDTSLWLNPVAHRRSSGIHSPIRPNRAGISPANRTNENWFVCGNMRCHKWAASIARALCGIGRKSRVSRSCHIDSVPIEVLKPHPNIISLTIWVFGEFRIFCNAMSADHPIGYMHPYTPVLGTLFSIAN